MRNALFLLLAMHITPFFSISSVSHVFNLSGTPTVKEKSPENKVKNFSDFNFPILVVEEELSSS